MLRRFGDRSHCFCLLEKIKQSNRRLALMNKDWCTATCLILYLVWFCGFIALILLGHTVGGFGCLEQVLYSIRVLAIPHSKHRHVAETTALNVSDLWCLAMMLPSLTSVDLAHNNLFSVSPHILQSSPHLRVINLSHNSISALRGNSSDIIFC